MTTIHGAQGCVVGLVSRSTAHRVAQMDPRWPKDTTHMKTEHGRKCDITKDHTNAHEQRIRPCTTTYLSTAAARPNTRSE